MCKFYHFRNAINPQPGFLENTYDVKGGCTVAFEVEGNTLRYAVAYCSPRDNFCRRTGRLISQGRLQSGKCYIKQLQEGQTAFDSIREAIA